MGVYLSAPVIEKESSDKTCPKFTYGVSSMQGWRMSQEDAHNCITDYDAATNTTFFAVYDGHGGAEVAQYTAAHLPGFIKNLPLYNDGKLADALQEAFLAFDETLTEDIVIEELKVLAGVDDDENEEVEDDEGMGRTEREILVAEANMPIEDLMAKYSAVEPPPLHQLKKMQKDKHQSPMIRAKKPPVSEAADNSDEKNNSTTSTSVDSLAMRLEVRLENGQSPDNDNNLNVEKELREAETECATTDTEPDSTGDVKMENINNSNSDIKDISVNNGEDDSKDVKGDKVGLQNDTSVKLEISEPDSTSDKDCETEAKSKEVISATEVSSGSSSTLDDSTGSKSSGGPSLSSGKGDVPSGSGAGSTSVDGAPSGLGDGSSSVKESCGSSSGPTSSGSSTGTSGTVTKPTSSESGAQAGGSGVASVKKAGLKLDEDSDDDSSDDDDEYIDMEDSDDEDDDEDDGDDDDIEQGGIFGMRRIGQTEEEDHSEEPGTDSGCTAVVALIRDDKIYVANAGDSRCVLCQGGKAVDLSFDHKPEDDTERTRIEAAGGKVTNDGRVNGGLNLSRALGDHWYKRNETKKAQDQMISALPDIECVTITPDDEFLIIACDGIWNFMTSQETVDFIRARLKDPLKRDKPSLVCEELFDFCLAPNTMGDGTGCDNMTCIIVVFNKSLSSSKRDSDNLDVSTSDDKQPEKRARVDENDAKSTDT